MRQSLHEGVEFSRQLPFFESCPGNLLRLEFDLVIHAEQRRLGANHFRSKDSHQQPLHFPPELLVRLPMLRYVEMKGTPRAEAERDDASSEDAKRAACGGLWLPTGRLPCSAVSENMEHIVRALLDGH